MRTPVHPATHDGRQQYHRSADGAQPISSSTPLSVSSSNTGSGYTETDLGFSIDFREGGRTPDFEGLGACR